MEVRRGDILIVVHGDLGRPRPAVVIQTDAIGHQTSTVLICPLTSELSDHLPLRPTLDPNPLNGIRLRSQIMIDKIFAIQRSGIRRIVGRLDSSATEQLDRALMVVLGLAR
jgi:mRNA interferase MazF